MSWRFWRRKHSSRGRPEEVRPPGYFRMPNGLELQNTHPASKCAGRPCVLHSPIESDMPLFWRNDRGIFERICPCGIGHPAEEQLSYWREIGQEFQAVHGCCGIAGHC